mmetsp:Transcript_81454/g.141435  ORF Transcript_81454/g.141435 Transcript_81454/m.141435 type:complete len:348 (+) Transcript_81454:82-1125(+)
MIGLVFRSLFGGPLCLMGAVAGLAALCGICACCLRCRLRDCTCIKRCLRYTGYDKYDDFELMVLVHEAIFEKKELNKLSTVVNLTAGRQYVRTDANSKSVFQQPLHICIEQGTRELVIDLLDGSDGVLATLKMDILKDILSSRSLTQEQAYAMTQKSKAVRKPKITLTMVASQGSDLEEGLLSSNSSEVGFLVRQQLQKAKDRTADGGAPMTETDVLKQACSGPLELFEHLGKTHQVFISVLGPPSSKRWMLGIWNDQHEHELKHRAIKEVDLLKVQSVQADPTRANVFIITYVNEHRVSGRLMFRRVDRARDVWVEMLQIMVMKARDHRKEIKDRKAAKLEGAKCK